MKKIIIIAFALFCAVNMSAKPIYGVTAGFTASTMKLKNIDPKAAAGFQAGVAANIPLALGFAIQPELIYNVKGGSWDELKSNASLGYIEVPVQLQYNIDLIVAKPYIFVEPFIGYAVTGNKVFQSGSTTLQDSINMENLNGRLEYGLGVGAGVMVLKKLQVSFKYFWNFEDCNLNNYLQSAISSVKERSSFSGLSLSAVYFF